MTGAALAAPPDAAVQLPSVSLFGVRVADATKNEAVALLDRWMRDWDGRARAAFIVNAHTLNLACEDPAYRGVLNAGDTVFGDGIGVRLAARLKGVRLKDNLVGTDLVPLLFRTTAERGYGYFLLGGTPRTAERAVARLRRDFPGIRIVGHHHGFVGPRAVLDTINAAAPDLLLVAMGNPTQERWIHRHLPALRVPLSIGVGGLFDHWAGNLNRAPRWMRRLGLEWLHILGQQPHKWRRYILGNPKFIVRALRDRRSAS